jgi:DNA-binding NarL/FixJ family response regulator
MAAKHLTGPAMSAVFKSLMASQSDYPSVRDLTPRQLEVMQAFLSPVSDNESVCIELSISVNTLETHLKSIFSKLGVDSLKKAIWRFVLTYTEYLPKFLFFYVAPAAELTPVAA